MVEFVGPGLPLTQRGVDAATTSLGVEPAALWAVLAVETSGCGFLSDRRPKMCSAASPRIATMPTIPM